VGRWECHPSSRASREGEAPAETSRSRNRAFAHLRPQQPYQEIISQSISVGLVLDRTEKQESVLSLSSRSVVRPSWDFLFVNSHLLFVSRIDQLTTNLFLFRCVGGTTMGLFQLKDNLDPPRSSTRDPPGGGCGNW